MKKNEITESESNTSCAIIERESMTPDELKKQVQLIQQVMNDVMQEGQHYGKIPGCGEKPTLLKPGAEKLSMIFKLRPIISPTNGDIVIDKYENGHREVTIYCHIINSKGEEVATGIGSCSTLESKFRYRGGNKIPTGEIVPTKYWNLKKEGKLKEALDLIGGSGFGVAKIDGEWQICEIGEKIENPDIADTYNTVLKVGKKRAYVDGILSATGASDIYSQDLEDFAHENDNKPPTTSSKPKTNTPESKSAQQQKTPPSTQKSTPPTNPPEKPKKIDKKSEVRLILNIPSALETQIGDTINVQGSLVSTEEVKVGPSKKDITFYTIVSPEKFKMVVFKWGKIKENIKIGDLLIFTDVYVKEFSGKKQFFAEDIETVKQNDEKKANDDAIECSEK